MEEQLIQTEVACQKQEALDLAEIQAERQRFELDEHLRREAEAEEQRVFQLAEQKHMEMKPLQQIKAGQQQAQAERLKLEAAEKQQNLFMLQEHRTRALQLRQELFQKHNSAAIVIQTQVY